MKELIVALIFCGFSLAAQAANPIQPDPTPDYCLGFSPDACARIKAVIDSKIRPAYCIPRFDGTHSILNLTAEQVRICSVLPPAQIIPENSRALSDSQARQNQMIEDARAMVRESWENYANTIEAIEVGYKCGVIDQLSGNVAVQTIQTAMQEELNHAGLMYDLTMSIQTFTITAVQAGKDAVERGACTRMTPASRGRLRSMVSDLTR